MDLGCGSGILSIAALRLGAVSAKAVDIDDKCLTVAYENAALNGIGKDRYTCLLYTSVKENRKKDRGKRKLLFSHAETAEHRAYDLLLGGAAR